MKPTLLHSFALACAGAMLFSPALRADSDFHGEHDAGGIVIDPHDGDLSPDEVLTITFPSAMVKADAINTEGYACPFVGEPKLPGTFLWKSQTEGEFIVGAKLIPGAQYRLSLASGLKDLAGNPVKVAGWGAQFTTNEFRFSLVNPDAYESKHLDAQQQVYLNSTWPVAFKDAAEHIYFQDRDSHEHHPVEVVLSENSAPESGLSFSVEPRDPLPAERTFDLVIDGVRDFNAGKPLPYIQVFPLGPTHAMKIDWLGAQNDPGDSPQIVIAFNDTVAPDSLNSDVIKIDPPVKNLTFDEEDKDVVVHGDFDTHTRYAVTVLKSLTGGRGYGLAADSHWHATFKPKPATLLFPGAQVFERSGRGLRFSFFQINAPKVTWKLAAIPPEKLTAVAARVREFEQAATDPYSGKPITDPDTDATVPQKTELLVDAFDLKPAGAGDFDATDGDKEVLRDIDWQPADGKKLTGVYLLEISGTEADGRVVGNRSLVSFSDLILTQKCTDTAVAVRLARMSDGMPAPGVTVHLVTEKNAEIDKNVTDQNGIVSFSRQPFSSSEKNPAYAFIADTPDGPALQFVEATAYQSGSPATFDPAKKAAAPSLDSIIITDRNLYRPAQTVEMKGMLRLDTNGALSIPGAKQIHWRITSSSRDDTLAEGDAALSTDGGWTAQWDVPQDIDLGEYSIHCSAAGLDAVATTNFRVDEYRVPLFSAEVTSLNNVGSSSQVKVASAYFHGAPNNGAHVHWKATWTTLYPEGAGDNDNSFERYDMADDRNPKPAREPEEMKSVEGDVTLDANGTAVIKCDFPFTDGVLRGRCDVSWRADITSIDGQTLTGGTDVTLQSVPILPGIRAAEVFKPGHGVKVDVDAVNPDDKPAPGLALQVDLYHVTSKTAKEKIAPFIYRYRNTITSTKVGTQTVTAPGSLFFPVTDTGEYAAVATAPNQKHTPVVSARADVSGQEPAEFPVENETTFKITHDDRKFVPGENAVLHLEAPFGGVAWVTVETNEILDTRLEKLDGNSGRIEVPIKKEYGPNAFISVYLVKPGGADGLPQERYAFTSIDVRVPERELNIATKLEQETVLPGAPVRGEITVTSADKPVQAADIAIFAVDDAVLKLGDWQLPDIGSVFYPERRFGVQTDSALDRLIAGIKRESLTEKGFIIGGGGEEGFQNITNVRKEFRTLAFWQGSLKTDADGKIKFEFDAPDNLTSYRIIAVGETDKNQFGGDASAVVKISKPLIAEPALPRFLRDGDELELRLVVREKCLDTDHVSVRCVPDTHLQLTGPAEATQIATNDVPVVFRFKAKVVDSDFAPAVVRFDAISTTNKEVCDSVQNTLPVFPPVIVRRESVAGTFDGPSFDPAQKMPDSWKQGHGSCDLTISTSPWLPKITGLPDILDYPHGCFDQVSSRMLSYGLLGDLLAYLPNSESREKNYRDSIQNGLKQFDEAIHSDGMLPYWDGETADSPFCTVEACWALEEISKAGFQIPEGLPDKLAKATREIALGHVKTDPFIQCDALMVLSQRGRDGKLAGVAQDLYLKRGDDDDETRAMLAIAMHQLNIMPKEKAQLMREIDNGEIKVKAFDPNTFYSTTRCEAIRALAFCKIAPENWTPDKKEALHKRLLELMDSSNSLSTQENLWLLLAFKAFQDSETIPKLQIPKEAKAAISRNGDSAGWQDLPIPPAGNMALAGLNSAPLSYIIAGSYMSNQVDTPREDRGFRVERVVRNLTDPKRTGTAEAPYKLGDQILILYRIFTQKVQNYVALEDELPAGLESVNFDLPMIGKFFPGPIEESNEQVLWLSHSEQRDQANFLYFYEIDPGSSVYGILARATVAGTFRWPSTQVVPMYDSRFSGLSPSSLCVVAAGD